MHKSRLAGFIIDCQTDDLDAAAKFWSQALGYGLPASQTAASGGQYRTLETGPGGLHIEVQQVEHPSRVHLDIETDDIEAEVQRLEKLGARRVKQLNTWWVMEAPTGQRFCVVRPQSPDLAAKGNAWD
jgi:predicted enzyme related to lactoylglutathione lyase